MRAGKIAAVAVPLFAVTLWAAPPRQREGDLTVGSPAPDFTVNDVAGKKTVMLSALKGKPVVLIFGSCT
jgi:cytochrome oxidase Cu insertion factor (SCO1/SenC/PrrC family)